MEERRDSVRRLAGAIARSALGALGALAGVAATACELPPGVHLESERLALAFWTIPAKIAVGQPFVLELDRAGVADELKGLFDVVLAFEYTATF